MAQATYENKKGTKAGVTPAAPPSALPGTFPRKREKAMWHRQCSEEASPACAGGGPS